MSELIRYRILMRKLRAEIAATVRAAEKQAQPTRRIRLKSTCKACESIV